MDEVKETLAILKARWVEAAVIIAIGLAPKLPGRHYPGREILTIGAFLLYAIISAGFLRTVHLEQTKQQSISCLIQTGKHFFLRLLGFGLILGLAMMVFVGLLRAVVGRSNPLLFQIGFTIITLVLAKVILLVPAIIIVNDCSLSESFDLMWKTKLLKAKPLMVVFLIQLVVLPYLPLLLTTICGTQSAMSPVFIISKLNSVVVAVLYLMVKVMAVRFVSSIGNNNEKRIDPDRMGGMI